METFAGESTAKRGARLAASASCQNVSNNADVDSPAVYSCNYRGVLAAPQPLSLWRDTRESNTNTTDSRRKWARLNEPHCYPGRLISEAGHPEDHQLHDNRANSLLLSVPVSYPVEGMVRSKLSERNLNKSSSARRSESTKNKAAYDAFSSRPDDLAFNQSAAIMNNHDFIFTSPQSLQPREQPSWLPHTGSQTCSTQGLANTFSAESHGRADVARISTSRGFNCNAFTDGCTSEIEYDPTSSALPAGRAAGHMEAVMVEPGLFGKRHSLLSNRPFLGIEVDLCGPGATIVSSTSASDSDGWNHTLPTSFPHDLDNGPAMNVLPSYSQGQYQSTVSNVGFSSSPYQATLDSNDSTRVDIPELSQQPCDETIGVGISQSDISYHLDTLGSSEGILFGEESVLNHNTWKELPSIGPVSWNNHAATHKNLNNDNANDLGLHLRLAEDFEMDHNSIEFPFTVGTLVQQHGIGCKELVSTCK
jgi:hypothetical protein